MKPTTKYQVESFLKDFKEKLLIWDVLFLDIRNKNFETLILLEISPDIRKSILLNLNFSNYSQGPLLDKLNNLKEMWVFGVFIKNIEIYIKISLGEFASSVICISFHIAEFKMNYPFKK